MLKRKHHPEKSFLYDSEEVYGDKLTLKQENPPPIKDDFKWDDSDLEKKINDLKIKMEEMGVDFSPASEETLKALEKYLIEIGVDSETIKNNGGIESYYESFIKNHFNTKNLEKYLIEKKITQNDVLSIPTKPNIGLANEKSLIKNKSDIQLS